MADVAALPAQDSIASVDCTGNVKLINHDRMEVVSVWEKALKAHVGRYRSWFLCSVHVLCSCRRILFAVVPSPPSAPPLTGAVFAFRWACVLEGSQGDPWQMAAAGRMAVALFDIRQGSKSPRILCKSVCDKPVKYNGRTIKPQNDEIITAVAREEILAIMFNFYSII